MYKYSVDEIYTCKKFCLENSCLVYLLFPMFLFYFSHIFVFYAHLYI